MGWYYAMNWACPFYRWDEKRKIHCDGGTVGIRGNRDLLNYARKYCANVTGWEDCSLARALIEQNERREKNRAKSG